MIKKIIPSILEKKWENIEALSNRFAREQYRLNRIEIDICDGEFVPNKTWPFTEDFKKEDPSLPNWEIFNYTAHMMTKNPSKYLEMIAGYGFDRIVVHFNSFEEGEFEKIIEFSQKYEIEIYMGIKIGDDLGKFKKLLEENLRNISGIQVMCIEKIGYQKQEFAEKSLSLISELRKFNLSICVDGGINDKTIKLCSDAGALEFVVGSFLVNSKELKEDLKELESLIS